MLFSILIAHYNNHDYFRTCYESIIIQSYKEYEVIVVDDCSNIESFEAIKKLTEDNPKVKIYRNEENKGVGFTKRRCVELATGEICAFLDPDDAITETAIEDALQGFDENTVAVYSQIKICDQNLDFIKIFPGQMQVKNNNKFFFNVNFEANHFFSFRKANYDKTEGINSTLTSAVDQDLYLKLYETGNFKFIKKPNYLYRIHEKGVSQEKSKKTKLNQNWHTVMKNTLTRRRITKIYGKSVDDIESLPIFIKKKQNSIFTRILRKFS